ncbi:hypothetical protein [Desulfofalx alkaliphila]|uniref:hypothetical protein n=1 Tax=Desulfofalx alkaliphila TaxID=105483 RepID=UPI0004E1281E|nr:hypothetical protein [Desulfofalx alkaliphila]
MRRSLITLITLLIVLLLSGYSYAQAGDRGSVVVVVMDRINLADLNPDQYPGFKRLMEEGAVGLLNCNTGGRILPENTHVTIGAGAHALGAGYAVSAFDVDTQLNEGMAADIYSQRTGNYPTGESIVYLGIARMVALNDALPRSILVGTLGESLKQAGYKTAVFGNADCEDRISRLAVNIAMDKDGVVSHGIIDGAILQEDPAFPGGKRTDYQILTREVINALPQYPLLVVDLGDTARLHEQRVVMFDDVYRNKLAESLKRADDFVNDLANHLGEKDLLLVVTPTPVQEMLDQRKMLTPIIAWGGDFKVANEGDRAMLISGTTKHPGIVMSTDITPTILQHLDIPAVGPISGRAMYPMFVDYNPVQHLLEKQDNLAVTHAARGPFQKAYVFLQIIILAASLYLIFIHKKGTKLLKMAILFVVSVPLAYLLLPLLPRPSVEAAAVELIMIALLLTAVAITLGRSKFLRSYGILAVATVSTLLLDTLLGQPLQKQAILSYDPMVGARFYGIGNEYMGVLLGATIMAASVLVNNYPRYRKYMIALSGALFSFTVYCLAAPHLGTNVGGTIAATSSFLVTFLLFLGVRFRFKVVAGVAAAVAALLAGFIAFDLSRPIQQQSHIGQATRLIIEGGFVEIINIIKRKLSMNLRLMRYTVWSNVLLASIFTLAALFYKPRGIMQDIKEKYPYIFKGLIGVVTGAIVAFAFNDSGVVAAATTMIFGVPPLSYLALKEQGEGRS